jgi:hypothetical protein
MAERTVSHEPDRPNLDFTAYALTHVPYDEQAQANFSMKLKTVVAVQPADFEKITDPELRAALLRQEDEVIEGASQISMPYVLHGRIFKQDVYSKTGKFDEAQFEAYKQLTRPKPKPNTVETTKPVAEPEQVSRQGLGRFLSWLRS